MTASQKITGCWRGNEGRTASDSVKMLFSAPHSLNMSCIFFTQAYDTDRKFVRACETTNTLTTVY